MPEKRKLKVLDLFSGILVGGFSLGLERTGGFETVAFCEIEEFPRKVLAKHWPEIPCLPDVRKITKGDIDGPIDLICGGYPCQPFSTAGKRAGEKDDRHLWPEVARLLDVFRPTWFIGENVAGHISMGLDSVLSDLEDKGYAARAFLVPACAVDAKHRRDRLWIVANSQHRGLSVGRGIEDAGSKANRPGRIQGDEPQSGPKQAKSDVAHPSGQRRRKTGQSVQQPSIRSAGASSAPIDVADSESEPEGRLPVRETPAHSGSEFGSEALADTPSKRQSGPRQPIKQLRPIEDQEGQASDVIPISEPRIWPAEPGMGLFADGISEGLDRIGGLKNADATKERAKEILSNMPAEIAQEAFQRAARRLRGVSETQVLLAWLYGVQIGKNNRRLAASCEEAAEVILRSVWHDIEIASSPSRPRCVEQHAGKFADALHQLSRNTPSQIQTAWKEGFWEDEIPRVATGIPQRVDRLKGLGNAVVPQIPEMIGHAILEAEGWTA